MERNYSVYLHRNKINNKRYIGITKRDVQKRWQTNGTGYTRGTYFRNAIEIYGWDNFEHIVLKQNLTKQEAIMLEKLYISVFHTQNEIYGYNMTAGGEGSEKTIVSEETRKKLSLAHKGHPPYPKAVEATRLRYLGRKRSPDVNDKIRKALSKPIYGIDKNGIRHDFSSIKEASIKLNNTTIDRFFNKFANTEKVVSGMRWYYVE